MLTSSHHLNPRHSLSLIVLCTSLLSSTICEASLSPFLDLLIWDLSEEPASMWGNITTTPSSNVFNYQVENMNFGFKPGLRGGFLYQPHQCLFDSRLYWTYYASDKKRQFPLDAQIINPGSFSSFLSTDSSLNTYFGANFDWRLMLNMLDYDISHEFPVSPCLSLRPSIGLKAGIIICAPSGNCRFLSLA